MVALRWFSNIIPTTRLQSVKSQNISSVRSRSRAWRHIMTMCRRKKTQLCVSQLSKTGMASRSSWLPCQMIRLNGTGNYTHSRIWDGMTITNTLSNTAVERSSKACDCCCGSQPAQSISFMLLRVALTAICHRNASIPKCTLRTGSGRHRKGEILKDNNVLLDV